MKTEFKTPHLYIGSHAQADGNKIGILSSVDFSISDGTITMFTLRYSDDIDDWDVFNDNENFKRLKLILRPLSSMTHAEMCELANSQFTERYTTDHIRDISKNLYNLYIFLSAWGSFDSIPWLLNKHFDIFNLIESGQAIDATTLPDNPYKNY